MSVRSVFSGLYFYILFSVFLFVLSLYAGFVSYMFFPTIWMGIGPFKSLVELFEKLSLLERIMLIFLNNSFKAILNILLGPILGIYPLVFILLNGFILGYTFALAVSKTSLLTALLAVIPHGIFELPAMIICNALGFRLACKAVKSIIKKDGLREEFKKSVKVFIYLIMPMLFIAAIIEVCITPILVGVSI